MRILITCSVCATERPDEESPSVMVPLEEDNAYVGKCPHGHVVKFTLDALRFEILFESGITAMLTNFDHHLVEPCSVSRLEKVITTGPIVGACRRRTDPRATCT
jgi:hypothetical protein